MNFLPSENLSCISTGSVPVDTMLGTGGLPRRYLSEIYGEEDSGKTSLVLRWIAAAQHAALTAVYVDAERKFDPAWAAHCGVNLEDLVLSQPDSGHQALAMAEALLRTFSVDFMVIDSAAALAPEDESVTQVRLEEGEPDIYTEFVARTLRRLKMLAARGGCALLVVNQLRSRMRVSEPETTAAGRVVALHAAVRIRLRRHGDRLLLTTVKNKLAEPFADVAIPASEVFDVPRKPVVRQRPAAQAASLAV